MTLYETIGKRRSVRSYRPEPLDAATLDEVRAFLEEADQMEGRHARFEIVDGAKVGGVAAPHCILAYCAENGAEYANVGYVLQAADLYLQSRGLGSLWMGMAKPNEEKNDFCILLAFGATDVPMRQSDGEFNRLPVSEISDTDGEVERAVRLAPSAVNSQPWKLRVGEDGAILSYFGRGMMKLVLKRRLSKIDLGIAARHARLALEHTGKTVTSVFAKEAGKGFAVELMTGK